MPIVSNQIIIEEKWECIAKILQTNDDWVICASLGHIIEDREIFLKSCKVKQKEKFKHRDFKTQRAI